MAWNYCTVNLTFLPSGNTSTVTCDPGQKGWITGFYGVDPAKCGYPSRRIITELSPKVAFGFKTFLHTPDADDHFLQFLTQNQLRHPDIIVMDAGIWGPRGDKTSPQITTVLTPAQEWDYYMDWIQTSSPQSHILLVHGDTFAYDTPDKEKIILQRFTKLQQPAANPKQRVSILRKDILMAEMPADMPCQHGCAGPVLQTLAVQLVDYSQQRHDAFILRKSGSITARALGYRLHECITSKNIDI